MPRELRVGLFPYLNVQLLHHGLRRCPDVRVVSDVPSKIASAFRAGELDLAMVPSFEAATLEAPLVDGIGIAAEGPVETVLLHLRTPLAEVRSLALDEASRTSAALSKLLVLEAAGTLPESRSFQGAHEQAPEADGILVIGDPAFRFTRPGYAPLDLGAEWHRRERLPFVFAVMAMRPEVLELRPRGLLMEALAAGREAASNLARSYNSGVDAARAERYMTRVIRYEIGPREKEGLALFHRLARERGLLPPTKELEFHAD